MNELALVLGGGASKGFAHIGVLKVLEEHGIKPSIIVGTSMGAIIGGLYSAGISADDLVHFANDFSGKSITDINLISILKNGCVMKGKKLHKYIYDILQDITHDDLLIPFTAVATELKTGKQHNLNTGYVWKNVLASSAIPAVFPSVEIDGKILSDGGLVDNLPIDVARKQKSNAIVLSVDVIGDYSKQVEEEGFKLINQILNMSTLYMSQIVKMKESKADLSVKISQPNIKQMDFTNETAQEAIKNGKRAMNRNIKKLIELLQS